MKTKIWVALLAILFSVNNSSWAQVVTTITAPGVDYVVPYGSYPDEPLVKIVVEKVNPSQVKFGFGWTNNSWSGPNGHPETGSTAGFITASLPGPYGNVGDGGGETTVSYISDPWIGVDQSVATASPHLTSFNDPLGDLTVNGTSYPIYGTIFAESYVEIQLSSLFSNSNYGKVLFRYGDENFIAAGVLTYQITSSGTYYLQTRSGPSCPIERVGIKVVITGSTTPTVTNVTVSPASASVEKGQTKQFTAEVTGTNNPATTVNWTVEGATDSNISTSGLLSVGSNETAPTLTVRATSTVDPSKSGTASVTVITPQPTVYKITATDDSHSTLSPNGEVSVNAGGSQTFTASYATGYERNQLLVDGSMVINANTYTFTNVQANHTIALTSKPITYTLTYHLNGGTGASNSMYTIESQITFPIPTKEGSIFKGWFGNAELTGLNITGILPGNTGNLEFWAKWEVIPATTYTITATDDEHSTLTPNGVIVVSEGERKTFTASYVNGYERKQLLVDGSMVVNADNYTFVGVNANHTISITSKAVTYHLTYHLDGGTGATNGTYTIESPAITLPIPEKANNHFEGWYDNAGLLGDPIVVLPAGSIGNREYWAKWTIDTGIEEVEKISFRVYPNPVQSTLFFTSEVPISRVAVYGLSGNKVVEKIGNISELELFQLHSGIYIVRVFLEGGEALSRKIVKY
ncbi:hypothetical protein FACS1894176_01480 [Bacteroidia bacterium]|nr:hypothetical protein FACS1894176_01480 [Bacteroidia bacterium]